MSKNDYQKKTEHAAANKPCEVCNGSRWYSDQGPGRCLRNGGVEHVPCEYCRPKIKEPTDETI